MDRTRAWLLLVHVLIRGSSNRGVASSFPDSAWLSNSPRVPDGHTQTYHCDSFVPLILQVRRPEPSAPAPAAPAAIASLVPVLRPPRRPPLSACWPGLPRSTRIGGSSLLPSSQEGWRRQRRRQAAFCPAVRRGLAAGREAPAFSCQERRPRLKDVLGRDDGRMGGWIRTQGSGARAFAR